MPTTLPSVSPIPTLKSASFKPPRMISAVAVASSIQQTGISSFGVRIVAELATTTAVNPNPAKPRTTPAKRTAPTRNSISGTGKAM